VRDAGARAATGAVSAAGVLRTRATGTSAGAGVWVTGAGMGVPGAAGARVAGAGGALGEEEVRGAVAGPTASGWLTGADAALAEEGARGAAAGMTGASAWLTGGSAGGALGATGTEVPSACAVLSRVPHTRDPASKVSTNNRRLSMRLRVSSTTSKLKPMGC
jgi:hypothetical protein